MNNKRAQLESDDEASMNDDAYFSDMDEVVRENCNDNEYSTACNKLKNNLELKNRYELGKHENAYPFLYPNLDDPLFNVKIAEKKEFNENKYDGTVHADVKEHADRMANAEFELQPQQVFVKNYMSSYTPYNSLIVFHGLGSGKTCTSIGVTEELRELGQIGITKKIIIVAAENVQDNFQLQLFDERNLKEVNGEWTMKGCVGNRLLKEIVTKGMTREKIISQAKTLIDKYYLFVGYLRFANYIIKTLNHPSTLEQTEKIPTELSARSIQRLRNEFEHRFIVIDEIHNIRKSDDNENKRVAVCLELLVQTVPNMQFLFLSATPMYNSYREIIWILNLMNINDRRSKIKASDVFDKDDEFKEGGKELLARKATGYVSFVRGENPYTFPYRIYPNKFSPQYTFPALAYPTTQLDGSAIRDSPDMILSLFVTTLQRASWQSKAYKHIIKHMRNSGAEMFGYSALQTPIESLIISYPTDKPLEITEDDAPPKRNRKTPKVAAPKRVRKKAAVGGARHLGDIGELTGKVGLARIMKFTDTQAPPVKGNFEYRSKKEAVFATERIGQYSAKIKHILTQIYNPETKHISEGIILIYSQYIDAGLIPMALALEEMGFTRYGKDGTRPLFKKPPVPVVDVNTMAPLNPGGTPARYSMITGDPRLSPNNKFEVAGLTDPTNRHGEKIKIVLISKAGSEGIDLKFIRQVHILDPWYNVNRIEQIIGRAVRNLSHKDIPFEKRNVQIFMHASLLEGDTEEPADLYIYRSAQRKAKQIGAVTRILKESAVDCLIHHEQTNFSQENMKKYINRPIRQELSSGQILSDLVIGDAPFSAACDYMDKCIYSCRPREEIREPNEQSYNDQFMKGNAEKIKDRVRQLFTERMFYHKKTLLSIIRTIKPYPLVQIYSALTELIEDKTEMIRDSHGRAGRLINIGDYYLFQPIELNNPHLSIYDRQMPIDKKISGIIYELSDQAVSSTSEEVPQQEYDLSTSSEIFQNIRKMYETVRHNVAGERPDNVGKKTSHKWEYIAGFTVQVLMTMFSQMDQFGEFTALVKKTNKSLIELLIAATLDHFIEKLEYSDKLQLLNYIFSIRSVSSGSIESSIREYFNRQIIPDAEGRPCVLLYDKYTPLVYMMQNNQWTPLEPYEQSQLLSSDAANQQFSLRRAADVVGFMAYNPDATEMIFKTKKISSKRDTGARCDQALKSKTVTQINLFLGKEILTTDLLKKQKISPSELCVFEELLLRVFSAIHKERKIWFISPEMALINRFYKDKNSNDKL